MEWVDGEKEKNRWKLVSHSGNVRESGTSHAMISFLDNTTSKTHSLSHNEEKSKVGRTAQKAAAAVYGRESHLFL